MSNTNCPYCDHEIEICHDDGYGFEEDSRHEQQCDYCNKYFTFTTLISYHYTAKKAECLNGMSHKLIYSKTWPKILTKMICETCDYERKCTDEELRKLGFSTCKSCGKTPCHDTDYYYDPSEPHKVLMLEEYIQCLAK